MWLFFFLFSEQLSQHRPYSKEELYKQSRPLCGLLGPCPVHPMYFHTWRDCFNNHKNKTAEGLNTNVENLEMFTMIWNYLARSIPDSEKKQKKQMKWQQQCDLNFDSLCGECRWCWTEHLTWPWRRVWCNVVGPRWQWRP